MSAVSVGADAMKYILTTDGDSHWFVIPADKEQEWSEWCEESERYWSEITASIIPFDNDPPLEIPWWAVAVGGAPSRVKFSDYEIG